MDDFELIAIAEVPRNKSVVCQASGCGQLFFEHVHVIRRNGVLRLFDSRCADKLFAGELNKWSPSFSSNSGIKLNESEMELLVNNIEGLVDCLNRKHLSTADSTRRDTINSMVLNDRELHKFCIEEVKEEFRVDRSINPDLPGLSHWVNAKAKILFKKLRRLEMQ